MFKLVPILCAVFLLNSALGCEELAKINVKKYSDSSSDFETLPLNSPDLKWAQKIVITGQTIPVLCANAIHDINVETIEFSNNKIGKIEAGAFKNLQYLSNLILTDNGIKEIGVGVFNELNVRKLNLSQNAIEKIDPKAFDNMARLDVLDLSHNKIKIADPNWFKKCPKLGWLILDHNQLKELPQGFVSFDEVHKVPLDVWVKDNHIKTIKSEAFQNVNTIKTLFLSGNEVSLPANMFKNVLKVAQLFLDNNQISCLDDAVLNGLKNVQEIHLAGNYVQCDCLKKIKNWGKTNTVEINALSRNIECFQERIANLKKTYGH